MTTRRQGRRWCACLLVTAAVVSAKSSPFPVDGGIQRRYPKIPSLYSRGGAQPSYRQPPPPPPRNPPNRQQSRDERIDQVRQGRIPPPPRQPPNGGTTRILPQLSHPDGIQNRHTGPFKPIPPLPKLSQRSSAANTAPWKPPPPPPQLVSSHVNHHQQQEARKESKADESIANERSFTIRSDESTTIEDRPEEMYRSSPTHIAANDEASVRSSEGFTAASRPHQESRADSGNDVLFLVPPKDELDRISLKTALSGQPKREQIFSNLIQLRQHMAIESLLASQQSVKEQMIVITGLLRELLAQQQSNDSLVLHVPRQIASIPPRKIRRRVEKVRKVPRKTILSSLEELDRDLSDGEFDTLIQGLKEPSEGEETYFEYEYDEEYPYDEVHSHTSHVTPNAEEVNAFLRESSESESWHSAAEVANNEYDSDVYYDDYYDIEPLEEELLAAWSVSDAAVASDELSDDEASVLLNEGVEESITDAEATISFDEDVDADYDSHVSILADNARQHKEGSHVAQAKEARARSVATGVEQQQQPPPPPRRPAKSQSQPARPHEVVQMASSVSSRWANKGLRQPPPPPRKPQPPPPPVRTKSPAVHYSHDEQEESDGSEDLNEDELQLLEETAVLEESEIARDDDVEDYDDTIDEDDLRVLQLSRWVPFAGRKRRKTDDDADLVVDDDVYFDAAAILDDVTTDDFTEFDFGESEPLLLPDTALDTIIEESSEEEMLLGESAVTEPVPPYGSSQSGKLPPPPPPRPPPRPPIEHGASTHYPVQQQVGSYAQHSAGWPQHPTQYQDSQPPPVPPTVHASNLVGGYRDNRSDGYQHPNQQ